MSTFAKSGLVCEYFLFGLLHFSECLKCILIKGKESPAALTTDSGQKSVSVPFTPLYLGSRWLREQETLDFIVFLLGCIPLFWILLKLMMQEPYFFPSRLELWLWSMNFIFRRHSDELGVLSQIIAFFSLFGQRQNFPFRLKLFIDKAVNLFLRCDVLNELLHHHYKWFFNL